MDGGISRELTVRARSSTNLDHLSRKSDPSRSFTSHSNTRINILLHAKAATKR